MSSRKPDETGAGLRRLVAGLTASGSSFNRGSVSSIGCVAGVEKAFVARLISAGGELGIGLPGLAILAWADPTISPGSGKAGSRAGRSRCKCLQVASSISAVQTLDEIANAASSRESHIVLIKRGIPPERT